MEPVATDWRARGPCSDGLEWVRKAPSYRVLERKLEALSSWFSRAWPASARWRAEFGGTVLVLTLLRLLSLDFLRERMKRIGLERWQIFNEIIYIFKDNTKTMRPTSRTC